MNSINNPVVNASINPAAARVAAATPTAQSTFTFTDSEPGEMISGLAAQALGSGSAAPAPAGEFTIAAPPHATTPEACGGYKLLTRLEQATSKVIVATRDRVVVPANLYVTHKATPQALAAVAAGCLMAASGTGRLSTYLARLAETAVAKSLVRGGR